MTDLPICLIPAEDRHMHHVVRNWLDSWYGENYAGSLPADIHHFAYREAIVKRIIPRSRLVVAAYVPDPNIIIGWACFGPEPQQLHYVSVKKDFQRARTRWAIPTGVATMLLATGLDIEREIICTFMTRDMRKAAEHAGWKLIWRSWLLRKDKDDTYADDTARYPRGPEPRAPTVRT